MQKTATPQNEASGQNPRKSYQYAHLQAHAWNGKEKRQNSHPQTNLWKSDSASPDDAKSCQKKETFPWSALSTSVGPITGRPTATPARAGYPLTLLITRHARNSSGSSRQKTPAPAGVTVAAQKVAAPAAVEAGHAIPHDAAAEADTPAKTPVAPREEEPDKLMTNLASSCKKQTGERQWTPLQNRRDARRCTRPQEAERQTPPHPPGAHVWPAVLLPRPASGQEKQVIARKTASGQASDPGERAIANDRAAPPDRQGNAHAHGGSGSGQKTATAHAERGHGVTDIDPRIETRHDATESPHAESGSGQKTATAHSTSVHEKSVKRTTTASHAHNRLTANGKRRESESDSDVHES